MDAGTLELPRAAPHAEAQLDRGRVRDIVLMRIAFASRPLGRDALARELAPIGERLTRDADDVGLRCRPPQHPRPAATQPDRAADSSDPAPQVGHPAPDFALESIDGGTVTLAELRGKVVLVNIWATWCPPCRAEMPAIEAAYQRHRDQGFVVLAVNQRERTSAVIGFMRERELTFTALLDPDGAVGANYQASAIPSSFFIGRDGIIRSVYRGPLPRGVIDATVESLLAE